jgi:NAD+ synthase
LPALFDPGDELALTDRLRIALAQLNPTVGALEANLALALSALERAEREGADILMLTELFLTGYFPEDLLLKPRFIEESMHFARRLAAATEGKGVALLLPTPWRQASHVFNAVVLAVDGEIVARRDKHELPEYDIFYEKRYFTPGPLPEPVTVRGVRIGVPICEDIWFPEVCAALSEAGAEMLLCPNGSPYWRDKHAVRSEIVGARVRETGLPLLYLNQIGGQDELVFDGASFALNADGSTAFRAPSFEPDLMVSDWQRAEGGWTCVRGDLKPLVSVEEAPWRACVLGLRDYIKKNGFHSVVLGLSGGIDSAVTAAIAVDALGPDKVHCLMLPYRHTSAQSLADAKAVAERLGVRYDIVPIGGPVEAVGHELAPLFDALPPDITEENVQSRMRGLMLMAVSNKLGAMLITTGNKSELAVGYATIYGDMNGGFNPVKDMYKTQLYELGRWRNANWPGDCLGPEGEVIPEAIFTKAPSAELKADQTDQDTLPPYDELDAILRGLVEDDASVAEIAARGFAVETVRRIEALLYRAEYKRRQAPPGVKLTRRAFGLGRKYPMTSGFRDTSGE